MTEGGGTPLDRARRAAHPGTRGTPGAGPLPPLPDPPTGPAPGTTQPPGTLPAAEVRRRRRLRWRQPHLAAPFRAPALTFWIGLAAGLGAWAVGVRLWGAERGTGFALLVVAMLMTPREVRMERFVGAAYDLALPICEFEQWEARRKGRWRSRLKTWGVDIDYTTSALARAGTRKSKWIRLKLAPRWSLWPREEHFRELGVRIPPPVRVNAVLEDLRRAFAEDFFGCPVENLVVRVERRLRRNWAYFRPGLPDEAAAQQRAPSYARVAERGNGTLT